MVSDSKGQISNLENKILGHIINEKDLENIQKIAGKNYIPILQVLYSNSKKNLNQNTKIINYVNN